jgi:hypothetical protein
MESQGEQGVMVLIVDNGTPLKQSIPDISREVALTELFSSTMAQ